MVTRETAIKTAKSFIDECRQNGLTFHQVWLFGSAVKNTAHEWSDIDLLLVSDQFNENVFDNLKLYSRINIKYPLIETHPYPTNYFYQSDDFINRIINEGIEINSNNSVR